MIGRKVPLDKHGAGYFTAEEAKYLKLEGWTPAPHRSPHDLSVALKSSLHARRVHFVQNRAVKIDDEGAAWFTASEAAELLQNGWKRR